MQLPQSKFFDLSSNWPKKGFLLKDPSQPQDIARLVRHFISDAIWIREISIMVYHPSASERFKYILRFEIAPKAFWNYQWFILNSCAVVSRNFLEKFLFVTETIDGISHSFTWKA